MFWLTPRTGNPPPTAQRTPATLASGTPPEEFRMQTCQRNGDAARDHPGDCPISMLCTRLMAMGTTGRRKRPRLPRATRIRTEDGAATQGVRWGTQGSPWRQRAEVHLEATQRTQTDNLPRATQKYLLPPWSSVKVRQELAELRPAPQTASP